MFRRHKYFLPILIVSIFWFGIYVVNTVINVPTLMLTSPPNTVMLEESLWRPNNTEEEFSRSDRIDAQRKWIKDFSNGTLFRNQKVKRILITGNWDHYYAANFFNCTYAPDFDSKCNFIRDKSLYPFLQEMEHFDGIVGTRNWEFRLYENLIPKSMQQFLYVLESPFVAIPIDLSRNNAILASYWRGSDICTPYHKWISHSKSVYENVNSPLKDYAENKTKLVAALISNCKDNNDRIKYLRELQKHINVDFYGKCGDLKCPPDCLKFLGSQYKFYLAFENSNCRDYITEKFFANALMNTMIPVVLGAHPEDYRSLSPPNSYIHVENFSNPKDLASYLKKVDEDNTLYNKYFLWKDTGYIDNGLRSDFFCRVCGMLFYSDFRKPPEWKAGTHWKDVNRCLEPHQWYWSRKEN